MDLSPTEKQKTVIGYPSPNNYPSPPPIYATGYHQGGYETTPYQSYMNNPNSNSYIAPSPNPYYKDPNYHGPLKIDDQSSSSTCSSIMFAFTITFLIGLCFVSLIIWMLFGCDVPDFAVSSLKVTSFNITNATLVANWDVNFIVANPNQNTIVIFDNVKTSIVYQNTILAMAVEPQVKIEPHDEANINSKLSTTSLLNSGLEGVVVSDIEKDRKNGTIDFSLRLALQSKYTSQSSWGVGTIRVFCENAQVKFTPEGTGNMTDVPPECVIFT